jgi:hypothetical protein
MTTILPGSAAKAVAGTYDVETVWARAALPRRADPKSNPTVALNKVFSFE